MGLLKSGKGIPNTAPAEGGGAPEGLEAGPTVMDRMVEKRDMRSMQGPFGDLKSELATLEAGMITKGIFQVSGGTGIQS